MTNKQKTIVVEIKREVLKNNSQAVEMFAKLCVETDALFSIGPFGIMVAGDEDAIEKSKEIIQKTGLTYEFLD